MIVPGFSRYDVSEDGVLARVSDGMPVRQSLHGGYKRVNIVADSGRRETITLHRLLAFAFLPPPLPGQVVVRHLDDNRLNNRISNLAWGTFADNSRDAMANGRARVRGSDAGMSKVTEDDVHEMRAAVRAGVMLRAVAARFGISETEATMICSGKRWAHLSTPNDRTPRLLWSMADMVDKRFGVNARSAKLTPELVADIKGWLRIGAVRRRVARVFGVAPSNIDQIAWGKTWRSVA